MNQKIYLVKKDPAARGRDVEWIQMTGAEFFAFARSPKARGRYFIRLTDDVSYECPEIFIEADYSDYRKWQKEYDAHRYLMETKESYETLSADAPVTDDSSLIDTLASDEPSVDDVVIDNAMKRSILHKISMLPPKDRYIITALYLLEQPKSGAQIARDLNLSRAAIHKRIKKILKKISE